MIYGAQEGDSRRGWLSYQDFRNGLYEAAWKIHDKNFVRFLQFFKTYKYLGNFVSDYRLGNHNFLLAKEGVCPICGEDILLKTLDKKSSVEKIYCLSNFCEINSSASH